MKIIAVGGGNKPAEMPVERSGYNRWFISGHDGLISHNVIHIYTYTAICTIVGRNTFSKNLFTLREEIDST